MKDLSTTIIDHGKKMVSVALEVTVWPRSQCDRGHNMTQISSVRGTIRVRGSYDFWRPKICLWTDHHTWWGGQIPEYELCFVRVLTIDACGQALTL